MRAGRRLVVLVGSVALLLGCPASDVSEKGVVTQVVDGKTLVVEGRTTLRLIGIDAPECSVYCPTKITEEGQKVVAYLQTMLQGKEIFYTYKRGSYETVGFIPAHIFLGGLHVNLDLIQKGYARYFKLYGKPQQYDDVFQRAEDYAKANDVGYWKRKNWTLTYLEPRDLKPFEGKLIGSTDQHFHTTDCKLLIGQPTLIVFHEREDALEAGYTPCPICSKETSADAPPEPEVPAHP
ncbi:MAG: hypothetical protein A2284_11940 [Deltaproteobacteria bacterium RIFOXYA12_FULL_61_11]|nr:MAG: hypothetical protein A2284_11940 [Deltaproteobacteria bacterium RIFOXYA12_FULL_61_11]